MRNSCIAITGIAGFIGMHVAKALVAEGFDVVGFDNFDPCYDVSLKEARTEQLKLLGVTVDRLDLRDYDALHAWYRTKRIDATIHLAAKAGVLDSQQHPQEFTSCNISGFVNLLEVITYKQSGGETKQTVSTPHPLVYASSSSVYGYTDQAPFCESTPTDKCASIYGATKKCNEILAETYWHLYQIPMIGLRFFTVYGPWGRPDMAYWLFADAISKGKEITLFNEGKMLRDFTYIDDITSGIIASVQSLFQDSAVEHRILNLGASTVHSLETFVSLIEKHLGQSAQKKLLPMQKGDVPLTHADISQAKEILGYAPVVSLDEGLKLFTQWYQQYHTQKIASC